jgi:hypothetical protein
LNALATNWRQKARNSANGLAGLFLCAGVERVAELIVAMTRALSSSAAFAALDALLDVAKTSFGSIC